MKMLSSASITLWLSVIFSANVIAQDISIYRWVDENGVVHFSQHQPQDGNYSQLTTFSSYKAKEDAKSKQTSLPSVDDELSEHEKEVAQVTAKNKEIMKKNCEAAQLNEKMLSSFDKVMVADSDGKNRALTDKEKKAQLELTKKQIETFCEE